MQGRGDPGWRAVEKSPFDSSASFNFLSTVPFERKGMTVSCCLEASGRHKYVL